MEVQRNHLQSSHRKDALIEWMKGMLNHSFVLNSPESYTETMLYFEQIIDEHIQDPDRSRLSIFVPSVGRFHTRLPLREAFEIYDEKYCLSKRKFVHPSFNEIRHILNLAQLMSISSSLKLITFDGDQTLYSDGDNFDVKNRDLSLRIQALLKAGIYVCLITAAGYGLDGKKYAVRLQGLLDTFIAHGLTKEEIGRFYVLGGECNYLLQCTLIESSQSEVSVSLNLSSSPSSTSPSPTTSSSPLATTSSSLSSPSIPSETTTSLSSTHIHSSIELLPIPYPLWQHPDTLSPPQPYYFPPSQISLLLDTAERVMREAIEEMRLRVSLLRKERAIGLFPGGVKALSALPVGHGSRKLKKEALDEVVLRVQESLRALNPPLTIPYCVFNGGQDAWVDVGNKSVGVANMQCFLNVLPHQTVHVGDQVQKNEQEGIGREKEKENEKRRRGSKKI